MAALIDRTRDSEFVSWVRHEQQRIKRRFVVRMLTVDGFTRAEASRVAWLCWLVGTGRLRGDTEAAW